MNRKGNGEKSFLLELLELFESPEDPEGVRKTDVRNLYQKKCGSISASRLGGAIDILVEFGLVSENQKTGLFSISPLGQQFLSAIRHERRPIDELCQTLLSKSLNIQGSA